MDFKIIRLVLGAYQTNCYIIYNNDLNAVIIDPGAEADKIFKVIDEYNLKVDKIILTHAHPDHFGAIEEVRNKYNIKVYMCDKDRDMLENRSKELSSMLGIDSSGIKADIFLKEDDEIEFFDKKFKVIETPGHTPGGMCLLIDKVLIAGDTLFKGSIGRTDLPGGDFDVIMKSLEKLMKLDDDILVLPGHGPETTIEYERNFNPFINRL